MNDLSIHGCYTCIKVLINDRQFYLFSIILLFLKMLESLQLWLVPCVAFPLKAENYECVVFESIVLNETLPFISGLD